MTTAPLRVFVASSGVGIANRGFETLACELFDALRGQPGIDVTLVKGRGRIRRGELVAPTVRRDGLLARSAGRLLGRGPLFPEQLAFGSSLLPLLAARRPQVVYVSEWWSAKVVIRARRRIRGDYRVLLSNGGPYPPDRLGWPDHVHQSTPTAYERAVAAGLPDERQTQLPLGVHIADSPHRSVVERGALRVALGLPQDRPVVLAVAALAFHHKRLDYLVWELARLPSPRPFLVMLGAWEPETPALLNHATSLLGSDGFVARTVTPSEVSQYYRSADVFVHTSLWEAFGRVMVEALAHGLPCVAHEGPTQRYVLGEHGIFGDFRRDGAIAELIPRALAAGAEDARQRRRDYARERFSWEALAPLYADMVRRCAAAPLRMSSRTDRQPQPARAPQR